MNNFSSFPSHSPIYHFSVDDVFRCLIEVSDKHIPLFAHPFFKFLMELHTEFDTNIGLHLFFKEEIDGKIRYLTEVTDIRKDLRESRSWLCFGPHALSPETSPYMQSPKDQKKTFTQIYREIDRFAGPGRYAKSVRLHCYSESYELASFFRKHGVLTLFSTDRAATCHRMPNPVKRQINRQGFATYRNQQFVRTHFRVEFLTKENVNTEKLDNSFKETIEKHGFLVFYTHEYELEHPEVKTMVRKCMKTLSSLLVPSIIQS